MNIKPIPTTYRGITFRSKLEAHWAVFFDQCGVKWEYEPQGFDLGDGLWYLPDFLLHDVPTGFVNEDHPIHWKTDKNGKQYFEGDLDGRRIIKNLWVEVKGVMDEESAIKIRNFSFSLDNDSDIIVVGNFPKGESLGDCIWEMNELLWGGASSGPCEYYQLGGGWSGFINYLAADKTGTIGIYGDCKWYSRVGIDYDKSDTAYNIARNYRFDHRKK